MYENNYIAELFGAESYYTRVFRRFERGEYIKNIFNPYAMLAGPIWYANRRICFLWCVFGCLVFAFLAHFFVDTLPSRYAIPLTISTYLIIFVFPSNLLLYITVRSFISKKLSNTSRDEGAQLKHRFETELERGSKKLKSMRV